MSCISRRSSARIPSALPLLVAVCLTLLFSGAPPRLPAEEAASTPSTEETLGTAVALNYCRASFYRIRKNPTKEVLYEEQEKILNNLNLTRVDDKEVITLYTSVLDEISQIGLSSQERNLYESNHRSAIRRQVTWDAVAFGTELATAQFGSAIHTGANSWWDYRNKVFQRDMDLHKIDKARVTSVMQRSSQFLDTFWNLARKKNIPDRWLVRGDDLDQLDVAMRETDPAVRLRILNRMETYMEAYPPYWYYVARTEQELGNLSDSIEVYRRLENLGQGHFRKDELLATAMANRAAVEDYLGLDEAVASARKSLDYSTDVWEANLMAARVLQRHGQIADAEDAILRNLDVGLEKNQSHVFLASLYYFAHDETKLVSLLNDPEAVAHLPAPVLLQCAALVGPEKIPPLVVNNIVASLEAYPRSPIGNDQLVVRVGHAWQLHLAKLGVWQDGTKLADPQVAAGRGYYDLKFSPVASRLPGIGNSSPQELQLELVYPDDMTIRLTLNADGSPSVDRSPLSLPMPASLRISKIRVGEQTLALRNGRPGQDAAPSRVEAARPVRQSREQESKAPFSLSHEFPFDWKS